MEKNVLVCYKEWKRPVAFQCDGNPKSDRGSLIAATREAYRDLLPGDQEYSLTIQIKNESWYGNFIDIGTEEVIDDRSVIQLVVEVSRAVIDITYVCLVSYYTGNT